VGVWCLHNVLGATSSILVLKARSHSEAPPRVPLSVHSAQEHWPRELRCSRTPLLPWLEAVFARLFEWKRHTGKPCSKNQLSRTPRKARQISTRTPKQEKAFQASALLWSGQSQAAWKPPLSNAELSGPSTGTPQRNRPLRYRTVSSRTRRRGGCIWKRCLAKAVVFSFPTRRGFFAVENRLSRHGDKKLSNVLYLLKDKAPTVTYLESVLGRGYPVRLGGGGDPPVRISAGEVCPLREARRPRGVELLRGWQLLRRCFVSCRRGEKSKKFPRKSKKTPTNTGTREWAQIRETMQTVSDFCSKTVLWAGEPMRCLPLSEGGKNKQINEITNVCI